jgi:lipoprotein-anchoring transpeptidase ErfK/SrfK
MGDLSSCRACFRVAFVFASLALAFTNARAAGGLVPPWTEPDDLPLPSWARSLAPRKTEASIFQAPSAAATRRGTVPSTTLLPLFGARRGPGCTGRWFLVGPMAWVCSDAVDLRAEDAPHPDPAATDDGLPFRYYFVGHAGASAYVNLETAEDGISDQDLDPGFGVAAIEQRTAFGTAWVHTRRGQWIALRDLAPAHPSLFHGAEIANANPDGTLDVAWVLAERAGVFAGPSGSAKRLATRARFDRVTVREERATQARGTGLMVRVSDDGVEPSSWIFARDLARPQSSQPPSELDTTAIARGERWIDVDRASQTLVAYEGARPVFATIVSTGRGPEGSDSSTPRGVHRIWVKLIASTMDNLEREDAERHYSIEDVPYVQFFDKAVALHGAFWHRDFGRVHSHGCVNLAPRDAEWLFRFTGPHLPAGWSAALPTAYEPGTTIRVR